MKEAAKLLLEKDARMNEKDFGGDTALICSCGEGYVKIENLLWDNNASI